MRLCFFLTVSVIGPSLATAAAQGSDPFEITVKAFTPAGAPLGEQTATCSPAKPCRFSWPVESNNQFKAVTLIVKESRPGFLQATAMHGLASPSVRLPNKPGTSASLDAVRSSPPAADVLLMKFEIERH